MAKYKEVERNGVFISVMLSEQIVPGTFEFALNHLVDNELDLSSLDARFKNDRTGASAIDPRVMLKVVLLGYRRGLISSRRIALACEQNVQFMAISGDHQPSLSHIAKFVRNLQHVIQPVFTQVLMICDAQGLIGKGKEVKNIEIRAAWASIQQTANALFIDVRMDFLGLTEFSN